VPQLAPNKPIVIDSSGWLEYFADTDRARLFAPAAEAVTTVIVPTVVLYEVYKRLRTQIGVAVADTAADYMRQGQLVDFDAETALAAATNGLPFADSIIYATAQELGATLWTQDAHFKSLPGVKYFSKS
jgi:toxin FitB